jgi:pimeloyl-ACP methyl ester carboxylesterase
MATVDNARTEIRYEVTGEGTPVVLLHGFPLDFLTLSPI